MKTIRVGPVEAAIWENPREGKRPSHSVIFKRSYKDGEDWKESDTYWTDHLPLLAKAADIAHAEILRNALQNGDQNRQDSKLEDAPSAKP